MALVARSARGARVSGAGTGGGCGGGGAGDARARELIEGTAIVMTVGVTARQFEQVA
jgi:hypothetical protein